MSVTTGDCVEVMEGMEPESVDAVVTDPPYGLEFMGKEWDRLGGDGWRAGGFGQPGIGDRPTAWSTSGDTANATCAVCGGRMRGGRKCECPEPDWRVKGEPRGKRNAGKEQQAFHSAWAIAALRVAKPGAYLLAFGGTRTVHRLTCALEDAGWVIRDMLVWAYACLSDDTEILTSEGWVQYNSARDGQHAAAFDTVTGRIRWEPIEAVHRYHHEGEMAVVGPSLVTLNHRVVIDADATAVPCLPGVWNDVHEARRMVAEGATAGVLAGVQRQVAEAGPALQDRSAFGVERRGATVREREDDGTAQSRLEGRRYRVQEARELLGRAVRSGAGMGATDGAVRWLRDGASAVDSVGVRLPADTYGMREPRESRPDGQRGRQPHTLAGQPDAQALRIGQVPDRHGEPDAVRVGQYEGVVWCVTVPSEAFVARRNGVVFVTGNSGFPKSRASLKPAWEPIVLARKPGPLRELNIDATRLPANGEVFSVPQSDPGNRAGVVGADIGFSGAEVADFRRAQRESIERTQTLGRWPANVILTDPIFDGGWDGVVGGGEASGSKPFDWTKAATRATFPMGRAESVFHDDTGTYSRFFLIPKASRSDREPLLPGELASTPSLVYSEKAQGPLPQQTPSRPSARRNTHPTVKPVELMRHLVRLVTPVGGTVLDPFLGSGTTAVACEAEGFPWIGIEQEPSYVAIAEQRLIGIDRGLGLLG